MWLGYAKKKNKLIYHIVLVNLVKAGVFETEPICGIQPTMSKDEWFSKEQPLLSSKYKLCGNCKKKILDLLLADKRKISREIEERIDAENEEG